MNPKFPEDQCDKVFNQEMCDKEEGDYYGNKAYFEERHDKILIFLKSLRSNPHSK